MREEKIAIIMVALDTLILVSSLVAGVFFICLIYSLLRSK